MSGTHMLQWSARPFLTARRVCGPSSTLPRTPGQLPGPDLSRRILFSEKQVQRGMFLAERSAGKFDSSLPLPIQPSRSDWLVSDTPFISGGAFRSSSKVSRVMGWWQTKENGLTGHKQEGSSITRNIPRKTGPGPHTLSASPPTHQSPIPKLFHHLLISNNFKNWKND